MYTLSEFAKLIKKYHENNNPLWTTQVEALK